jgi:hypothetical protein
VDTGFYHNAISILQSCRPNIDNMVAAMGIQMPGTGVSGESLGPLHSCWKPTFAMTPYVEGMWSAMMVETGVRDDRGPSGGRKVLKALGAFRSTGVHNCGARSWDSRTRGPGHARLTAPVIEWGRRWGSMPSCTIPMPPRLQ